MDPIPMAQLQWNIMMVSGIFIFIMCLLLCWYYWKLNKAFEKFPSQRFDSKFLFKLLTGRLPKVVKLNNSIFQILIRTCERSLKEGISVIWFVVPYLFIYNEEVTKRIANEPSAGNKMFFYDIGRDIIGNGLLTSNGATWRKHRKLLNPIFYLGVLKGQMHIFKENAVDLVKKFEEIAGEPTENALNLFQTTAFSIMAESILGLKKSDEKYGLKIAKYMESLAEIFKTLVYRFAYPWLYFKFLLVFYSKGRKYLKLCNWVQSFNEEVILDMKKNVVACETPTDDADICKETRKSFAHVLIEQHLKDPTFTIQDIEDEVRTIMVAGHDTTSRSMTWCVYLLGLHPEIQEKTFNEIESVLGEDVVYDDLCKLTYMESVIKETMRLYPILPIHGRTLSKEIQHEKYVIPKGTNIIIFSYLLHRNPDIYPDPTKFDPERFSENSETRPRIHMPFSEGYRSCIGKKFALMEMKVLLVHILRRFTITTLNKIEDSELEWKIFLTSSRPVRVIFNYRQHRSQSCPLAE